MPVRFGSNTEHGRTQMVVNAAVAEQVSDRRPDGTGDRGAEWAGGVGSGFIGPTGERAPFNIPAIPSDCGQWPMCDGDGFKVSILRGCTPSWPEPQPEPERESDVCKTNRSDCRTRARARKFGKFCGGGGRDN